MSEYSQKAFVPLAFFFIISSKHVSCKFDKFRIDAHLCKLRDIYAWYIIIT